MNGPYRTAAPVPSRHLTWRDRVRRAICKAILAVVPRRRICDVCGSNRHVTKMVWLNVSRIYACKGGYCKYTGEHYKTH